MSRRRVVGFRSMDWATFSLYLSLVAVGWLMIFTVGYGDGYSANLGDFLASTAGRQTIWIGIALIVFSFVYFLIDWKLWRTLAYLIYAFSIVLLIAVLFFGTNINGAKSWFAIGGFSFQPSEIAKFGTCLAMASFLSDYNTTLRNATHQIISFGIFLLPIGLILLQPDAGSALVFLSFLLVLFREGLDANYFVVGSVVGVISLLGLIYQPVYVILGLVLLLALFLSFNFQNRTIYWVGGVLAGGGGFAYVAGTETYLTYALLGSLMGLLTLAFILWQKQQKRRLVGFMSIILLLGSGIAIAANYGFNNVLKPHQQDRINVWLRPELCDPRGSLYTVIQSKMTISSGGLQGKGFLKGTMTKFNYVPEQATDFIFCTVGEEQGFIGSFGIIILFLF